MKKTIIKFYTQTKFGKILYHPGCEVSEVILKLCGVAYITSKKLELLAEVFDVQEIEKSEMS